MQERQIAPVVFEEHPAAQWRRLDLEARRESHGQAAEGPVAEAGAVAEVVVAGVEASASVLVVGIVVVAAGPLGALATPPTPAGAAGTGTLAAGSGKRHAGVEPGRRKRLAATSR